MAEPSPAAASRCTILFSGGFRPFFLLAAVWAALIIPIWLGVLVGHVTLPTRMAPLTWHVHEAVFGFGAAVVAGFLLTAVPNWTGRLPIRGTNLAVLVLLWAAGRVGVVCSGWIGAGAAAILDLVFPLAFLSAVAREILAGRNWRNLPVLGALGMLLVANTLVHLGGLGLPGLAGIDLEPLGLRLGLAALLMLIALIGGRIIPSFTRNWLVKQRPDSGVPAPFGGIDRAGLILIGVALLVWTFAPDSAAAPWAALAGGLGQAARLSRWRGLATLAEPLLWVLHLGYAWLAVGLLLVAFNGFWPVLPASTAVHALTVGAVGCMTLAVMTRASLGHTGRPLVAGTLTTMVYILVTLAALLRLLAPLAGDGYLLALSLSAATWTGAFALFVFSYGPALTAPRTTGGTARPI